MKERIRVVIEPARLRKRRKKFDLDFWSIAAALVLLYVIFHLGSCRGFVVVRPF